MPIVAVYTIYLSGMVCLQLFDLPHQFLVADSFLHQLNELFLVVCLKGLQYLRLFLIVERVGGGVEETEHGICLGQTAEIHGLDSLWS